MIGIGFTVDQAKRAFIDRQKIERATHRGNMRVLARFGAFVRQTARRSIRRRKSASKPGNPPTNRTGLLKRFIFFAVEPERDNVLIGPAKLNAKRGNTPEVLEEGGRSTIEIGPRRRTVDIEPRPYMGPAFQKESDKHLPDLWAGSIR